MTPGPVARDVPAWSPTAVSILEARYLQRDADGALAEDPEGMLGRVARAVAADEDHRGRFLAMMRERRFLPNSPTLMNAGTPEGQLSACFVLPIEDSMDSIFGSLRDMALVQASGGGTGFSFSRLRPADDPLAGGGTASGPVGFIQIFDAATANIKQGGKRRGANMGILRCDHPDIMAFIDAKRDEAMLRNFNLSVGVTDDFMQAVEDNADHELRHPGTGQTVGRVPARDVFDAMVDAAWRTGDPGVVFLDAIRRADPMQDDPPIEATNPCGEVPLRPYEACTLGSIHLGKMVEDGRLDGDLLQDTVRDAVRFLDDVVEVNHAPIPAIRERTLETRKIGLGVMGFAEMLVRLGIPYDSDAALDAAHQVMAIVEETSQATSRELADERGVFPAWPRSIYDEPMRNATRTAIAPTGTIGLLAGTTAGIEPPWALAYRRQGLREGESWVELHPLLEGNLRATGHEAALAHVRRSGTLAGADVPEETRRLFVTALEVPVAHHLAVQAVFQEHTDNAVSKTINMPRSASRGDVAEAYMSAWRLGLKGVTVYRHGSKSAGLYELGAGETPDTHEHRPTCDPGECEL